MQQTMEDKIKSIKLNLMTGIAKYKIDNNLTQSQLAARCELDQPRVSRLLNGRFNGFTIDQLVKITYKLGIDLKLIRLLSDSK